MIRLTLDSAEVRHHEAYGHTVVMPQNGAILAYCDTADEAKRLAAFLRACAAMLRAEATA